MSNELLELCKEYGFHGKTLELIEEIEISYNKKMTEAETKSKEFDEELSGGSLFCCDISGATFLDWIEMTASKDDEDFKDMADGERFMYALGLLAFGVL